MKNTFSGAVFSLLLFLLGVSVAEENFIDLFHSKISDLVHQTVERLDRFFVDPRIKEETKAYIRIRGGFRYETVPELKKIQKADFKIRLAKIEKHLGLFIESYKEKITKQDEEEPVDIQNRDKDSISLGIEHHTQTKKFLKHRFSVGFTSSPKFYIRYDIHNIPVIYKRWEITIYQRFRAERRLTNNKLEETTQVYIDRLIAPKMLWRIYVDRYKSSNIPHQMLSYSTSLRLLKNLHRKPLATELLGGITQTKLIDGRISLYTVQNRFRLNFYKDWGFFNVYSGVNWQKERGFKGTPFIQVFFEFYFGRM